MNDSEWEEYRKAHKAAAQQGPDAFRAFLTERFGGYHVNTIAIYNSKSTPLYVQLEPIGMGYQLPVKEERKNARYELIYSDRPVPSVEVNEDGSISIYDIGSYFYQFFLDGDPVFE